MFSSNTQRGATETPPLAKTAGFPLAPLATNLSLRMHRIYAPRIVADHIMMQDDFVRLHKFLLDMGDISDVSEDVRKVIEDEWPELARKLPPKED